MKKRLITVFLVATAFAFAQQNKQSSGGKCPFHKGTTSSTAKAVEEPVISSSVTTEPNTNRDWWPNQLDLSVLRSNSQKSNPMNQGFNYKNAFNSLDYNALKNDIRAILTQSQDWWPADFGHYGPLFIRMAWHSAGLTEPEMDVVVQGRANSVLHR